MGAFSILNNIAALNAQNQLSVNNNNLSRTFLRLSSGKRINSGADDAAGLQIADSLRANVRALDQAVRNAMDGISVAQIADGALEEISNILTRAVTLAEESATETTDAVGRASLDTEYKLIQAEIARIVTQTNFNGVQLFTQTGLNGSVSIFVGDTTSSSSISVTVRMITTSGDTVTDLGGQDLSTVNLTTAAGAANALGAIKNALSVISGQPGGSRRGHQSPAGGHGGSAESVPEHAGRGIDDPRRQRGTGSLEPDEIPDPRTVGARRPGSGQCQQPDRTHAVAQPVRPPHSNLEVAGIKGGAF